MHGTVGLGVNENNVTEAYEDSSSFSSASVASHIARYKSDYYYGPAACIHIVVMWADKLQQDDGFDGFFRGCEWLFWLFQIFGILCSRIVLID